MKTCPACGCYDTFFDLERGERVGAVIETAKACYLAVGAGMRGVALGRLYKAVKALLAAEGDAVPRYTKEQYIEDEIPERE